MLQPGPELVGARDAKRCEWNVYCEVGKRDSRWWSSDGENLPERTAGGGGWVIPFIIAERSNVTIEIRAVAKIQCLCADRGMFASEVLLGGGRER